MIVNLNGKLLKRMNYRSGTSAAGNTWQSVDVLIGMPVTGKTGVYTYVILKAVNDRADIVKVIEQGSEVRIKAYIAAREYKGRWYNNFDILEIESIAPPHIEPAPEPRGEDLLFSNETEDLPF